MDGVGFMPLKPALRAGKKTLLGRKSACASLTNSDMPMIMVTMAVSLPAIPGRTMSPKPVVVTVATVKYSAST